MRQYIWGATLLGCFATLCTMGESRNLVKRDASQDAINPGLQHVDSDDQFRDKRKVDAAFGVKNAVLGFVFNKLNTFIDQKTAWIDQLDKTNIAKNHAHGIEPPKDPVVSLSGIISGVIGQKLQAAGPLITIVTNKLSSGSGSGSSGGGHTGFNFGSLLGGLSGGSSGGGAGAGINAHAGVGIGAPGPGQLGAGVSAYGAI